MKIIATLGNESHTSSMSRVYAKIGSEYLGYRQAKAQERLQHDKHHSWDRFEFDLPESTVIELTVKGQDGNRGANQYRYIARLRVDSTADVIEVREYAGPAGDRPWLKGRLSLVSATAGQTHVDTNSGF
jgi:hypothetical protein